MSPPSPHFYNNLAQTLVNTNLSECVRVVAECTIAIVDAARGIQINKRHRLINVCRRRQRDCAGSACLIHISSTLLYY